VGTMLASAGTLPSNNSLIEKWCYNNSTADCTTYGGLYTWAEANQLATTCNTNSCTPSSPSQGICPSGWHIPTDTEIKTLEVYLGMCTGAGVGCVDYVASNRGTNQGTQLKSGGSSGFNALFNGHRFSDNTFYGQGTVVYLWSASESNATTAWERYMSSSATVGSDANTKKLGDSVRCLKN